MSIAWTVHAGLVTRASIAANTTGDETLATYSLRWRFDSAYVTWPFVFALEP